MVNLDPPDGAIAGSREVWTDRNGRKVPITTDATTLPADGRVRIPGIDPTPFLGRTGGSPLELLFRISGARPTVFEFDDIALTDSRTGRNLPVNGDFETGHLDGWTVGGDEDTIACLRAAPTTPVPLLGAGIGGLGVFARRRRCKS